MPKDISGSLDTVEVELSPRDTLKIMRGHDRRNETWSLNGIDRASDVIAGKRVLQLNVDGIDASMQITLNVNGTWTTTVHHILGEAPNNG